MSARWASLAVSAAAAFTAGYMVRCGAQARLDRRFRARENARRADARAGTGGGKGAGYTAMDVPEDPSGTGEAR